MAKDLFSIKSFHGGINDRDSSRDIEETQFPVVKELDVSSIGTIRSAGAYKTSVYLSPITTGADYSLGYGYHTFKSDNLMNGTAGSAEYIVTAEYPTGVVTGADSHFSINSYLINASGDLTGDGTETGPFNLGANASTTGVDGTIKPSFYYIDGGLRVSPGIELTGTTVKKYQLLDHTQMSRTVPADWYWLSPTLTPPTASGSSVYQAGNATGITEPTGDDGTAPTTPTAASGGDVSITYPTGSVGGSDGAPKVYWQVSNAKTGFLPAGQYEFASTWVYDGGQESLPTKIGAMTGVDTDDSITAGQILLICATFRDVGTGNGLGTNGIHSEAINIIGSRIYIKRVGYDFDPWHLCLDVNFGLGSRSSLTDTWGGGLDESTTGLGSLSFISGWGTGVATGTYGTGLTGTQQWHTDAQGDITNFSFYHEVIKLSPLTYEALNGYRSGLETISFGSNENFYKCSTVVGRRAFVANVKYSDNNGTTKRLEDRILYTPPNKFDTFPESFNLDIGADDGEAFTALESHSGVLFAFKENNMYMVNVQSGTPAGWALLGKYDYKGVGAQSAVAKTELGLAWANQYGCFISQGKQITNLTKSISPTVWSDFITKSPPLVGWSPKDKKLFVHSTSSNHVYIFDTGTGAWIFTALDTGGYTTKRLDSKIFNGELTTASLITNGGNEDKVEILGWDDSESTGSSYGWYLKTKDIDFGNPGLKKKVYGCYLTLSNYNEDITGFTIKVGEDGGSVTGTSGMFETSGAYSDTITGSNDVIHKNYKFTTSKLVQSIQLQIQGKGLVSIDDISLEYRPTRKRIG